MRKIRSTPFSLPLYFCVCVCARACLYMDFLYTAKQLQQPFCDKKVYNREMGHKCKQYKR